MGLVTDEEHLETLLSAAEGETIAETAARWQRSERYVGGRRQAAVEWLGAHNICHAIYIACRKKLIL